MELLGNDGKILKRHDYYKFIHHNFLTIRYYFLHLLPHALYTLVHVISGF